MAHNPKIVNKPNDIVEISGSVQLENENSFISSSQIQSANSIVTSVSSSQLSVVEKNIGLSGIKKSLLKVSSSATLTTGSQLVLANAASGTIKLYLPEPSSASFHEFNIKKTDSSANNVVIHGNIVTYNKKANLTGSESATGNDQFGTSVAMDASGNMIAVGSAKDGKIYTFTADASGTCVQKQLIFYNLSTYGRTVAISSTANRLIISRDTGSFAHAAVVIWDIDSLGFASQTTLMSSSADFYYVNSISINSDGNRFVVGDGTTIDKCCVYDSGSTGWSKRAVLTGSLASSDGFGSCTSINAQGNQVVVGAYLDESGSTTSTGLAYVFNSGSTGWRQTAILSGSKAIQTNDGFGISVANNSLGDVIVVGAYQDETGSTGDTGLAYVFNSGTNGWYESAVLTGSGGQFGRSVSVNSAGDIILVGAPSYASGGSTYIFTSSNGSWKQAGPIVRSDGATGDLFGFSTAISADGNRFIASAHMDEIGTTPSNIGLVYLFDYKGSIDGQKFKTLSSSNESATLISDGTSSWSII